MRAALRITRGLKGEAVALVGDCSGVLYVKGVRFCGPLKRAWQRKVKHKALTLLVKAQRARLDAA